MDKNTNNSGNVHPLNLPVTAIPISDDVKEKFLAVCERKVSGRNVCGPTGAAEAVAQAFALNETAELLNWLHRNSKEMVFCPNTGEVAMLEAVAISAQGANRIEHAIQYVYHHSMIKNLLFIYETHQEQK